MTRRPAVGVLVLAFALALTAPAARAQDPIAPPGAPPHWLPDEEWVKKLWLPFEEARLYRLLKASRGEVFRWVRIDAHNTLGQLGRRRGMGAARLADALVAPRRGHVSARTLSILRRHAFLVVTNGHLGQHFLFHSLHQTAIAERAHAIFGVRRQLDFLRLRRWELSPLQIGELHGHGRVEMQRGCERALRDAAHQGVRQGYVTRRQAQLLLDRQLALLPRWLGQTRYNGPSGGRNQLRLPRGDVAKHPSISADGMSVVWDAYRQTIHEAERLGEIHVSGHDMARHSTFEVSAPVDPRSERPRSAYNAVVSADGGHVVFESAESTFPLAKRVGQMSVLVRDLAGGRLENVSQAMRPAGAPTRTAFNPSISADGNLVAFEATDAATATAPARNALWIVDRTARTETAIAEHGGTGAALLPKLAADGSGVAYTAAGPSGRTLVYVHSLLFRTKALVSRATGAGGAAASGDAYEPSISQDGAVIAFTSRAANLGRARGNRLRVWLRDLRTGTTELVSRGTGGDACQPAVSPDGRFVAFVERIGTPRGTLASLRSRVWLVDRATGSKTLVSRRTGRQGGPAKGYQSEPVVAAGGTRVAFTSLAGNLSARKPFGLAGVFVRDIAAGTTTLLSEHTAGSGDRGGAHHH